MKIETGSESDGKVNTPNKRKRVENQVEQVGSGGSLFKWVRY